MKEIHRHSDSVISPLAIGEETEPHFGQTAVTEGREKKWRYNLLHNVGDSSRGRGWDGLHHH